MVFLLPSVAVFLSGSLLSLRQDHYLSSSHMVQGIHKYTFSDQLKVHIFLSFSIPHRMHTEVPSSVSFEIPSEGCFLPSEYHGDIELRISLSI